MQENIVDRIARRLVRVRYKRPGHVFRSVSWDTLPPEGRTFLRWRQRWWKWRDRVDLPTPEFEGPLPY